MRNYFLPLAATVVLGACSPSRECGDYARPEQTRATTQETSLVKSARDVRVRDYASDNWYANDYAFWGSALEQLAGTAESHGVVDLFATLAKYPSFERESWHQWEGTDAVFRYNRDGERHNFSVRSRDGSFEANYGVGVDENNSIWVVSGEVFRKTSEGRTGWNYALRPAQINEGSLPIYTGTLDGHIGDKPLWRSRTRRDDSDVYTASRGALNTLRDKRLSELFRGLQ